MKIFKKAVVLLLIFVFAAGTFSLAACGRKGNSDALELFVNNGDKFAVPKRTGYGWKSKKR